MCQKSILRDKDEIIGKLNEYKTKGNSFLLHFERQKRAVSWVSRFERDRVCLIYTFPVVRTVGSRHSKKQSRSMQRGLRVDTDLVEFRQLQEVGVISYMCYYLAKSYVNG